MAKYLRKNIITALCFVFLLCLSLSVMFSCPKTVKAYSSNIDNYYNENLELIKTIDADGETFNYFYNLIVCGGSEEKYFSKMESITEIATTLKNLKDSFLDINYSYDNYNLVKEILNKAENDVQIKDINFSKSNLIEILDNANNSLKQIKKNVLFNEYLISAKNELLNRYNYLLSVNNSNPLGHASQTVGFYDDTAKNEVQEYYNQADTELNELVYNDNTDSENRAEVDLIKQTALDKMDGVPKNDIERAYFLVMDYNAIKEGDREGDLAQTKEAAEIACNSLYTFWENSSAEIKSEYNAKKQVIDSFVSEPLTTPVIDKNPQSHIETQDGAVSIYSYKRINGIDIEFAAFPTKAFVTVYNSANSAGKRNASRAVGVEDKKLSVGYFFNIDIYVGTKIWNESKQENVIYKVYIDFDKYFKNYVENNDGLIEKWLESFPFLRSKVDSTNKFSEIKATENYIKSNLSKSTSSLVYYYSRQNGEGVVAPLNYQFNTNGGVLMFETEHFSTFAITNLSNVGDLFINPKFWLIVAGIVLVFIILVIVIIVNTKYTVKFISNGGSKVPSAKARKGECFEMPIPPTKDGFIFAGWFVDENLSIRFIDTYIKRRKNIKVYAKWVEVETPERVIKYYEKLKTLLLSYSKVGYLADMGIKEKEILAKLTLSKNEVYIYLALDANKLISQNYNVEEVEGEMPTKFIVKDVETLKVANSLIEKLMQEKGLVFVGKDDNDDYHMTVKEKKIGFTFAIINKRVASTLADYYELIRDYTNSHVIYDISSPDLYNGKALLKMYLKEDAIYLYLAIDPVGSLMNSPTNFGKDTPSYMLVNDENSLKEALEHIDEVMQKHHLIRDVENSAPLSSAPPKDGSGYAYVVQFTQ